MGESNDVIWALCQGIIKESETNTGTLRWMTWLKSLTGSLQDKVSGRGVIFGADIVHGITAVCIDFFFTVYSDFVQIHCPFKGLKCPTKSQNTLWSLCRKKENVTLSLIRPVLYVCGDSWVLLMVERGSNTTLTFPHNVHRPSPPGVYSEGLDRSYPLHKVCQLNLNLPTSVNNFPACPLVSM